jgi:hypothetical protein
MSLLWIQFSIVIFVQFLLFFLHAWYEKRLREVPRILIQGIAIGVPFGIMFDLLVGKFLGLYWYELGFTLSFLSINGALSYGLMQANVLLMERVRFLHFYVWTILVGIIYEVTNYFFPVWHWDFGPTAIELVIVHSFGYIGLAILMALSWHTLTPHKFFLLEKLQSSLTK